MLSHAESTNKYASNRSFVKGPSGHDYGALIGNYGVITKNTGHDGRDESCLRH